jgi:diaminopimelate decarboxylase
MVKLQTHQGHLQIAGCDVPELAAKYGTPFYLVNQNLIEERCEEIHASFLAKYPGSRAAYASKAFLCLEMCRIIAQQGLGLDVVSGGELFTAVQASFPMEHVIFHGNNKTDQEIAMAVEHQVGRVVVDNMFELERLQAEASRQGKVMEILFRITPGVDSHTHKFISTGQLDSKFGIPTDPKHLREYLEKGLNMPNLQLLGFHFHVGSQLHANDSHLKAVEILTGIIQRVKEEHGFITKELNVGGGYGIYYTDEDNPEPLSYFTDGIMETLHRECASRGLDVPAVTIEPGRWVIGEAGMTVYTIGSIKEVPGIRTYAAVDGGMPDNPRPSLYDAKYDAVIANKMNAPRDNVATVAGKCCESGDILIWDLPVPQLAPGDLLAVRSTGAYNFAMASNYNRLPRPGVVMVKNGLARLVVRPQSYQDMLSTEI